MGVPIEALPLDGQVCPGKMLVQFLGVSPMLETTGDRLARPCAGYPCLHFRRQKTWMAGLVPGIHASHPRSCGFSVDDWDKPTAVRLSFAGQGAWR